MNRYGAVSADFVDPVPRACGDKGSHLEADQELKRQIGLAWQRAMRGQGLFLWLGDSAATAQGRGLAQQIQDGLRTPAAA